MRKEAPCLCTAQARGLLLLWNMAILCCGAYRFGAGDRVRRGVTGGVTGRRLADLVQPADRGTLGCVAERLKFLVPGLTERKGKFVVHGRRVAGA